jgi:hypothetical protein
MNDYGAGGAALFDIVNVQIWTRRRIPARSASSLSGRERRRDPLSIFPGPWVGLAHRAEHSPCKREAGGSSPPASTMSQSSSGRAPLWLGGNRRSIRRCGTINSTFGIALVAKRQTQPPQKRPPSRHGGSSPPGCTIFVCASSCRRRAFSTTRPPYARARFAKRPRHRSYTPTFPGSSPGASTNQCDDREIRLCWRRGWSEFLDLNHTIKSMILVSLMIAKFAPGSNFARRRASQFRTLVSRSSKAEHPADNRKTAVRYRAGEPSPRIGDHHDLQRNEAACRRISTAVDPERSSLRRLGSGLLIRAPEVQLLPGSPTAHLHTTSSIGQSAVLLSRRFAVQVRGRVPIRFRPAAHLSRRTRCLRVETG